MSNTAVLARTPRTQAPDKLEAFTVSDASLPRVPHELLDVCNIFGTPLTLELRDKSDEMRLELHSLNSRAPVQSWPLQGADISDWFCDLQSGAEVRAESCKGGGIQVSHIRDGRTERYLVRPLADGVIEIDAPYYGYEVEAAQRAR